MIDVVVFQNISILKKMWMLCLGILVSVGDETDEDPALDKKKDISDSSDALSDQVLSLDIVEDNRDRETRCCGSCV